MPEIRACDLCSVSIKDNLLDMSRAASTGITENQDENHGQNKIKFFKKRICFSHSPKIYTDFTGHMKKEARNLQIFCPLLKLSPGINQAAL